MNVIVLDCETTNSLEEPIAYDIGWAVIDIKTEKVIKTESFVVAEIFLDKELMSFAYYADKIPQYWADIKAGKRTLTSRSKIRNRLWEDCRNYEVKDIYAHNARFDYRSCSLTQRYLTCSKYRYFFPYGTRICDTLKMARQAFNDDDYKQFCIDNAFLTQNGQNRYTAEIIYRYLTNNLDFEEEHKGLDDVMIEKEILFACRNRGITDGVLWG